MGQRKSAFAFHIHLAFLGLIGCCACTGPDNTPASSAMASSYFSLEEFFRSEATRLTKLAPTVEKTVSRNGMSEGKSVQINDWKNELALFMDSDINKPAWQNSYRVDSTDRLLTYTSTDPGLRTQKISIEKDENEKVKHIAVFNHASNMLYQTEEHLDYYPDSLYQIHKQQQVRLIGESQYSIRGVLQ